MTRYFVISGYLIAVPLILLVICHHALNLSFIPAAVVMAVMLLPCLGLTLRRLKRLNKTTELTCKEKELLSYGDPKA
ncbi:hypothetical protein VST7929_00484 [Vibrio stylophorae]|uniref:Uncharacterized protein n=1 Tax=Vibrio stylophorae TaxID=659351 RepID=A0ABN8DNC2_9VIBR|nr:hypothetical protein [Vibrio stylophorae]CAH0532644.1 hypothetical protein VST7929_00484 [Vibrio stylophorae]